MGGVRMMIRIILRILLRILGRLIGHVHGSLLEGVLKRRKGVLCEYFIGT